MQTFISNKSITAKDIALQMAFFVRKYGDDYLSIGSDFFGAKNLPVDLNSYFDLKNLKICLKEQGILNKSIRKIFYENFLKFKNFFN